MAFYIAQTISVLTAISAVIMMQFKNIKGILAGQIITNLLSATTYFLLGGLSGAGVCLVAIVQSVVMFCYSMNAHKPHLAVSITFIVAYLGCSVLYYQSPIDVLSAVAAVCLTGTGFCSLMMIRSALQGRLTGGEISRLISELQMKKTPD